MPQDGVGRDGADVFSSPEIRAVRISGEVQEGAALKCFYFEILTILNKVVEIRR